MSHPKSLHELRTPFPVAEPLTFLHTITHRYMRDVISRLPPGHQTDQEKQRISRMCQHQLDAVIRQLEREPVCIAHTSATERSICQSTKGPATSMTQMQSPLTGDSSQRAQNLQSRRHELFNTLNVETVANAPHGYPMWMRRSGVPIGVDHGYTRGRSRERLAQDGLRSMREPSTCPTPPSPSSALTIRDQDEVLEALEERTRASYYATKAAITQALRPKATFADIRGRASCTDGVEVGEGHVCPHTSSLFTGKPEITPRNSPYHDIGGADLLPSSIRRFAITGEATSELRPLSTADIMHGRPSAQPIALLMHEHKVQVDGSLASIEKAYTEWNSNASGDLLHEKVTKREDNDESGRLYLQVGDLCALLVCGLLDFCVCGVEGGSTCWFPR